MESETLYRRLQQHLDRMPVGFPSTASGVEIRILRQLFTPEEAEVALELSAIPEPAGVIHKRLKSKRTLAALSDALGQMALKGIILGFPVKDEWRYSKLIFAVGVYERQLNRLTPDLERDALQYMEEAFGKAFHSKKTTQMRIVPVNKVIAVEHSVATYDDIRAYVAESPGPFARMNCICRQGKELLGKKCVHTGKTANCLTFGKAASWTAHSGAGRMIPREEMLALLDEADQEGLVLQPENTRKPLFVCCCCGCCCGVLNMAKQFARPADYFSSTFQVAVNADTCESCGTCEMRCQMDAINTRSGTAEVDLGRCIGCALCASTCPSGSIRLEKRDTQKLPPDDTQALFLKILQERYGPWGMAKLGARKMLGMKI